MQVMVNILQTTPSPVLIYPNLLNLKQVRTSITQTQQGSEKSTTPSLVMKMMDKKKFSILRVLDVVLTVSKLSSRLMKSRARLGYGVIPRVGQTVLFQSKVTMSTSSLVGT